MTCSLSFRDQKWEILLVRLVAVRDDGRVGEAGGWAPCVMHLKT